MRTIGEKNMKQLCKFLSILGLLLPSLGATSELYKDEQCLTATIFFESRAESVKGQKAVADVVLNRTKHTAFRNQDTICKVVLAPSQFSWVKGDSKRAKKILNGDTQGLNTANKASYQKAKQIAIEALSEGYKPLLPKSVVSFHNRTVLPDWAGKMRFYATIGSHSFYSFKRKGTK